MCAPCPHAVFNPTLGDRIQLWRGGLRGEGGGGRGREGSEKGARFNHPMTGVKKGHTHENFIETRCK